MPVLAWGAILLAAYYAVLALRVAPSRRPGPIAPCYEPPEGLSPAALRYVLISGTDGKTIAAILAQLVCRGLITLTRSGDGYEVKRTAVAIPADLPKEEQVLVDMALAYGDPNVIRPSDSRRMDGMVSGVEGALLRQYQGVFSTAGFGKIVIGVLASLVWTLALSSRSGASLDKAFATVWGLGFTLILFAILWVRALPAWRDLFRGRLHSSGLSATVLVILLPLVFAGAGVFALSRMVDREFAVVLISLAVINVVGGSLLRAPTPRGRKVLDAIAGYRQFLIAVEQDRLNRTTEADASRVDPNMAYAIALDIKEGWGDHLCEVFFAATVSKG